MTLHLNHVQLLGNVGKQRDIEVRMLNKERKVATFPLATSSYYIDKESGDKKQVTQWHKIRVYAQPLIEVVEKYLEQGSLLQVWGEIQYRDWEDKEGKKHNITEIILQGPQAKLILLDKKPAPAHTDT